MSHRLHSTHSPKGPQHVPEVQGFLLSLVLNPAQTEEPPIPRPMLRLSSRLAGLICYMKEW
jgi:hypothetical protein